MTPYDKPASQTRILAPCTATIYHQQHRNRERYEVRYYNVDGSKQRVTFPTHSGAKKFAEVAVKELAANRERFVTLRGRDAFDYQTALRCWRLWA